MVIDLTNNSNVDAALLNFDAGNVMTTVKKDLGMFDKARPLSDAKEELKNLIDSRDVVSAKVIDAIKSNDKTALKEALKKQRLLNKMIYIVQSEVDYKTQVDFMKANAISKAPVQDIAKEVVEKAKETAKEIESDVKDKEELTNLVTDIKASNGDVLAKAKSKARSFLDNPKEYFTTKNVLLVTVGAFALYGAIKFIK
jgi:hypothetical protein